MSLYLYIDASQEPFRIGPDENNRTQWSVNFLAKIQGASDEIELEIAKKIEDDGYGTRNTDIFVGTRKKLPNGDGPYTRIIQTGGLSRLRTHGSDTDTSKAYARPGLQIVVTGDDPAATRQRIVNITNSLDGITNTTLASS